MSKKHRKKDAGKKTTEEKAGGTPAPLETISLRGKKAIGGGVALLALGFFVLTLTDPNGRNWASALSPFLILGAYGVIALGIFLPEAQAPALPTVEQEGPGASSPSK